MPTINPYQYWPLSELASQQNLSQPGTPGVTAQQIQQSQPGAPTGYEDYLKIFQNTLGASPELDKKRRNQLAIVAGINALGQALKQVVDFHGRSVHDAPINPHQDQLTPTLLSMYDKEMQDYLVRKSQYDLQKTQKMQDAFKYAYGDKQQQEAFDRQLEILGKEQDFRSGESTKELDWKTIEADQQRAFETQEREGAQDDFLMRMKKQFEYDMALEKERAKKSGNQIGKILSDVVDGWGVIDKTTGSTVSIPQEMFWDVLASELKEMNMTPDEFSDPNRLPSKGYGSTEEEAKAIVTGAWNKYYQPVYDDQGKQVGWDIKRKETPGNKSYKTFWDLIPDATPGTSAPSWFKIK